MSNELRLVMLICCTVLMLLVLHLVRSEKLQLKYSLLWLFLSAAVMVCALFPMPIIGVAKALGFEAASNFIFFAGFLFLLVISLSLSAIASHQKDDIKNLVQRVALLEHELKSLKDRTVDE